MDLYSEDLPLNRTTKRIAGGSDGGGGVILDDGLQPVLLAKSPFQSTYRYEGGQWQASW